MIAYFKKRKIRRQRAQALYEIIRAQARRPDFYAAWGVPDTIDGRFELLLLHAWLVWDRLRTDGAAGAALAQGVFDALFVDMDRSMRLGGVGDLSVPHHMKRMMKAAKGRATAYTEAGKNAEALKQALRRNLFGTVVALDPRHLERFISYVAESRSALSGQSLLNGQLEFKSVGNEQETGHNDRARMAA